MTFKLLVQFIELIAFVAAIIIMAKELGDVEKGQVSQEALTGGSRALVGLLAMINPIFAGAIFHYGWRKRLPMKAKTANRFSFLGFFLIFGALVIYVVVSG